MEGEICVRRRGRAQVRIVVVRGLVVSVARVGLPRARGARKRLCAVSKVEKPPKKLRALTARQAMRTYMEARADHMRLSKSAAA